MKCNRRQSGLSLLWVAVGSALVALVAMGALFSMRYERNFFLEAWNTVVKSAGASETLKKTKEAVGAAPKSESQALRKCMVNGAVTYSNVECEGANATSKVVKVQDSQGFDAPKAPPPPPKEAGMTAQDKMIEKALQH